MNDKLKMRASPMLVITRIIVFSLILLGVISAYYGLVDPRTEEEKMADYKEELLSNGTAQFAVDAIKYARVNARLQGQMQIEEIGVIVAKNRVLVMLQGKCPDGSFVDFCYDAKNDCEESTRVYEDICLYNEVYDNFIGHSNNRNDFETIYKGEDLKILCEEAGWKWH